MEFCVGSVLAIHRHYIPAGASSQFAGQAECAGRFACGEQAPALVRSRRNLLIHKRFGRRLETSTATYASAVQDWDHANRTSAPWFCASLRIFPKNWLGGFSAANMHNVTGNIMHVGTCPIVHDRLWAAG